MAPMTPILPMTITPADSGHNMVRLVVIVAVLTSAPWAWLLNEERAAHEQQLAAVVSAPLKLSQPRMLTIEYGDGAKVRIAITQVNLEESR